MALYLRRRTGSWLPICSLAAACKLAAGALYCQHVSVEAARDELQRRRQQCER